MSVKRGPLLDRLARSRPTLPVVAVAVMTAIAAFLRFFHLDCGLPGTVYVDAFKFVDEAARMAASGDFAPRDFQYPGLYTNLLAILYAITGAATPYARHLIALMLTASAGVALVPVTYLLARRLCGTAGSLLAAGFAVACPVLLIQARTPAPDILMSLFVTAALCALLAEGAPVRSLIAAGAFSGLAAGSKFNGGYLLPWLASAGWLLEAKGHRDRAWRRVLVIGLAGAACFVATTPWLVPRIADYASRFRLELNMQRIGQLGRIQDGWFDYLVSSTPTWEQPWLGSSLLSNLGLPAVLLALAALAGALLGRGGRRVAFVAAFVVLFVVMISGPGHMRAVRFLLPVIPALHAVMGWFFETAILPALPRLRAPLAVAIAVVVLAFPASRSLHYVAATRLPLTNELAEEWVEKAIPPGTTVGLGPFYADNLERLPLDFKYLDSPGMRQYRFPEGAGPSPERRPLYYPAMVAELRGAGVHYLVLNSYFDGALSPVPENLRYFPKSVAAYEGFMSRLNSDARLVYSVKGMAEGRLGPDISIYRLD